MKYGKYADISQTELVWDSIFGISSKLGLEYIKSLDIDRLLAPSYEVHGIMPPNGKQRYGGWERKGANNWEQGGGDKTYTLAGHSLGHWMSAASVFYAQTNDDEILQKLNYAVNKLNELQITTKSNYIGGCEEETFIKMFNSDPEWDKGYWVPWYGIHKIYQGLADAYYYAKIELAFTVLKRFCDWAADGIEALTDEFMQNTLDVEYGGMNEVFAQMYEFTGIKRYLTAAQRFTHNKILSPLAKGIDDLEGKHANTQIPKIIGAAKIYEQNKDLYKEYKKACENFWEFAAINRSYAIGGNSISEHFEAEGAETLGIKTCESCNSYNMLKLTEHLFKWDHKIKYMDYYENVLYNHILGQQDPQTGSKMYFVSLLQGHHRIYEQKEKSWWCCTGTGMENPGRYTKAIYYEDGNQLYINLYIPTSYRWLSKGIDIYMDTDYPYSNKIKIKIVKGNVNAVLNFRTPQWSNGEMIAEVNGLKRYTSKPGEYLKIDNTWNEGDVIELTIPMNIWVYNSRTNNRIVFKYGPITLAQQLSKVDSIDGVKEYTSNETALDSITETVSYLVMNDKKAEDIVEYADLKSLVFKIPGKYSSDLKDIYLKPFYEIHHCFYNIYWDIGKSYDEYEKNLNKVTVDRIEPDGQQDEIGHALKHMNSVNGSFIVNKHSYFWRSAYGLEGAYFQYTMNINPNTKYLFVKYWCDNLNTEKYICDFDIYVDGVFLANQKMDNESEYEKCIFYKIHPSMLQGKSNISIKFIIKAPNCSAGKMLEMRTVTDIVEKIE